VCEIEGDQDATRYQNPSLDAAKPQQEEKGRRLDDPERRIGTKPHHKVPEHAEVGRQSRWDIDLVYAPIPCPED